MTSAKLVLNLKNTIDYRLNEHLVDMKEGYDDSIVGFNEAWDIVRKAFEDQPIHQHNAMHASASQGRKKHPNVSTLLVDEHDRRVTELLEANNREVEKRRELEAELEKAKAMAALNEWRASEKVEAEAENE